MITKKIFIKIISFCIDAIRPMLGSSNVCIYPFTCTLYMKLVLAEKPIYIAIPLIIVRLLSCNPINAIYFQLRSKKQ